VSSVFGTKSVGSAKCASKGLSIALAFGPGAKAESDGLFATALSFGSGAASISSGSLATAVAAGEHTLAGVHGFLDLVAAIGEDSHSLGAPDGVVRGSALLAFGGGTVIANGSSFNLASSARHGYVVLQNANFSVTSADDNASAVSRRRKAAFSTRSSISTAGRR
jgi:hypothetical protein